MRSLKSLFSDNILSNDSRIPVQRGELWVENELFWLGLPIDVNAKKCVISEVKRRCELEKVQLLSKIENPPKIKPSQWQGLYNGSRKCAHGCVHFWRVLTGTSEIGKGFGKNWKNRQSRAKNLGTVLKIAAFATA